MGGNRAFFYRRLIRTSRPALEDLTASSQCGDCPFHCSKDQILCSICDDPYCRFMIFMSLSLLYLFNSICIHLAITILVPYVVWMNIPLTSPIYDIIGCNYIGIHQCIFKCIIKYVTIHFTVILVEHPFTTPRMVSTRVPAG